MQTEALRICNLPISWCSALAIAFQGESWNNEAGLIQTTDVTDVAVAHFHACCSRCSSHHLPFHGGGGGSASRCYSSAANSAPM